MAKINIHTDCGNAPRKIFLKNLYIAFANADIDFITQTIPENISWDIVGQKKIHKKNSYIKELKSNKIWKVKELTLDAIITHGSDASVSGNVIATDDSAFSFCDVYRFKSAGGTTIKSITTFSIKQCMQSP